MTDDYRVKGRSNLDIRQLAKKTREFFGIAGERRVDVLACLASKSIWTVRGKKQLNFQIRPDAEMGTADGITSHGKDFLRSPSISLFVTLLSWETVGHETLSPTNWATQ